MKKGFTLIELVIGMGIFLMTILGVLSTYQHSLWLSRYSQGYTLALQSAQGKIEEMRGHDVVRLLIDYGNGGNPGNTFDPEGITGKGAVIFVQNPPSGTQGAIVVVCWMEKGRLFGEDQNLDGRFTPDEDRNGNNRLDSPVELLTYFTDSS